MKKKASKRRPRRNDDMDMVEWVETFLVLAVACGLIFYIVTREGGTLWFT